MLVALRIDILDDLQFHHAHDGLLLPCSGGDALTAEHSIEGRNPLRVGLTQQVLVVEPRCLDIVKLGSVLGTLAEVEQLHHFVERHNLLVVAGIPAEQSQEVIYSLRQIALLTVTAAHFAALGIVPLEGEHREAKLVAIAFAELAIAYGLEQQGQVSKGGHRILPAESLVEKHMQRS